MVAASITMEKPTKTSLRFHGNTFASPFRTVTGLYFFKHLHDIADEHFVVILLRVTLPVDCRVNKAVGVNLLCMIRTFKQSEVEALAQNGSIPIINGLTDFSHPCQVLADLMTIREYKGSLDGLKMCFIGDGNNMMNSLIVACLKMKMEVAVACPSDYKPSAAVLDFAVAHPAFSMTTDPMEAAKGADVLITDVWASMGQEAEAQKRREAFKGFQINDELMTVAKSDAMVQHCLPAHRGEEISAEIFEKHAKEIFDEAENRLHAQKAVLVKLLGNK